MSCLALFLLLTHGLVRVVVVAVDLAADVALQPVHREVHAAQAPGLVGLLDAEEGVSGRIDTDLANRKRWTRLDERVYPRIDDEGAAFVVYVGDDEILWFPAFREHDVNVDNGSRLELAPYRFSALSSEKASPSFAISASLYSSR